MRCVLTVAGSDSGAGAGVQADLKTFAALGVYGLTAVTSVTAQNTQRVSAVLAVSPELVAAQMASVATDFDVMVTKTGMLPSAAIVRAVAVTLSHYGLHRLVVDPVMVAKTGDRLVDDEALDALRAELLPRALVVTPNIPEAEALAGMTIASDSDRLRAAETILGLGPSAVIVKGGHFGSEHIRDLLLDADGMLECVTERVASRHTHGTGCTFSAALVAYLAQGHGLRDALPAAQRYVAGAIRNSPGLGHGHGPMQHFWALRPDGADRL